MPARRKTIKVAFQGELGAFSHTAAQKLLGLGTAAIACSSFREVFEAVRLNRASHAVLPIENTLHGSIHENYDYLLEYGFPVTGETNLRISHQLITMPGVRFANVKQVFSHPVALNQCRRFFLQHPAIKPVPFYDTAGSVKMLREDKPPASAAIASKTAAEIYGGTIRKRNIEDDPQNFTRFFLLSKQTHASSLDVRDAKISLVFSMPNTAGALFKALACFALRNISLTKIESRPLKGKPWEYLFYVDLLGSRDDRMVKNALANLEELTEFLKVLGSYRPTP